MFPKDDVCWFNTHTWNGWYGSPLQYSCLENSHGQRNLVGYSPWDCKEADTTKHRDGWGLPWRFRGKESACQFRRCGFDPWVEKIPWWRKRQPTPVCSTARSHGQRSLAGYRTEGYRVGHGLMTKTTNEMDECSPRHMNHISSTLARTVIYITAIGILTIEFTWPETWIGKKPACNIWEQKLQNYLTVFHDSLPGWLYRKSLTKTRYLSQLPQPCDSSFC